MKVFDLRCEAGHGFEGWFASEADYLAQDGDGRVACPMCGVQVVHRLPSAPRLNFGAKPPTAAPTGSAAAPPVAGASIAPRAEATEAPEAQWLRAVRHVMAHTEDVGERFADEARRIHHGEAPERGIRGQATPAEAQALHEEGIDVMPLMIPPAAKGTLQ